MDPRTVDAVIALGRLSLAFGRVDRATRHEDGVTPESDTDHTVMLGLVACALAAKKEPSLDIGKVATYALVHDLVEAYAGDTNTFGLGGDVSSTDKHAREEAALARIRVEFGDTLPWIPETIESYEKLADPEARFVKSIDKSLPKLTHILNKGAAFEDWSPFVAHCEGQVDVMERTYGKGLDSAIALYRSLYERARVALKV